MMVTNQGNFRSASGGVGSQKGTLRPPGRSAYATFKGTNRRITRIGGGQMIEKSLQQATGVRHKKDDETRQDYLHRLVSATKELDDKEWNSLDPAVRAWVNEGVIAINAEQDIPDFTEAEETDVAVISTKKKVKTVKVKEAKTPKEKAPKVVKEKAPKVAKEKAPRAARALNGDGVKVRIKRAIMKNPQISTEELIEQLSKGGQKVSKVTVGGIRSEFRHSLKFLIQDDHLKSKVAL